MADESPTKVKRDAEKLAEITLMNPDQQCVEFLRAFVAEFAGCFQDVLALCEEFKKYLSTNKDGVLNSEMEEDKMHLFLERRGETMTVHDLREQIKEMDLDRNRKISFIEYCLFKYKKTVANLFEEHPENFAALIRKLEEAIEAFKAELEKKRIREEKMLSLKELSISGSGVKASKAAVELAQMESEDQLARNKAEIQAGATQRRAKKELEKGDPFEQEKKKVDAENKKKAEEAAAQKAKSRASLKEKASLWN
jgi:hypothetical protein